MSDARTSQLKAHANPVIDPGPADRGHKIILPQNTTAHLAEIPNEPGSVAYDTDQQSIVINDGTGFQPVSGGGGGDATSLRGKDLALAAETPSDGNILKYSTSTDQWTPQSTLDAPSDVQVLGWSNAKITVLGDGTGSGSIQLNRFGNDFSTTIKALDGLAADYTLTLPADDGDPDQALTTDGAGNLSWATTTANPLTADFDANQFDIINGSDITTDRLHATESVISAGSLQTNVSSGSDVQTGQFAADVTGANQVWIGRSYASNDCILLTERSTAGSPNCEISRWGGSASIKWEQLVLTLAAPADHIDIDTPSVIATGDISAATMTPANGASGTFVSSDAKTVTVVNGIITSIV